MSALPATALLIAAVFLALGSAKVLALAPMRARAAHLGFSTSSYRVIGGLEIAGAIGVLLGLVVPPLGAGRRCRAAAPARRRGPRAPAPPRPARGC